jgi:hypothetical protein
LRDDQKGDNDKAKGNKTLDYIASGLVLLVAAVCGTIVSKSAPNENANDSNDEIAHWTRVVGIWTRGLVIIGVITAVVLGGQAYLLWMTDNTARISNRPYVFLRDIVFTGVDVGGKPRWAGTPIWENGGNTSTGLMKSRLNLTLAITEAQGVNLSLPSGFTRCDMNLKAPTVESFLGPKASSKARFFDLDADAFARFQQHPQKRASHIWGWARYADPFSERERITRYCLDVQHVIGDPNDIKSDLRLSYSLCSEGNCTDGDCEAENEKLQPNSTAIETFCTALNRGFQ